MRSNRHTLFLSIAIIGLVFFAAGFVNKCGSSSGGSYPVPDNVRAAANAGGGVITSTAVQQDSPAGLHFSGKFTLSAEQLATADRVFLQRVAAARGDNLTQALDPRFYFAYTPVIPCEPSPEWHVPSFLVRGDDPWDGSEYDQYNSRGPLATPYRENGILYTSVKDGIGVTYAAELILSLGTPGSNILQGQMFVCTDLSVIGEAVANGFDHISIANNGEAYPDGYNYYYCSEYHGADNAGNDLSHPLLPRNGRCPLDRRARALKTAPVIQGTVRPPTQNEKDLGRKYGIESDGTELIVTGKVLKPVK